MNKEIVSVESVIKSIKEGIEEGINGFVKAGKAYFKSINENYKNEEIIKEACPEIPSHMWKILLKIGNGTMSQKLLYSSKERDFLSRYSIADQEKCLIESIDVYLPEEGTSIKMKLASMDSNIRKIVFAKDHVRTIAEQRAFLESDKIEKLLSKKANSGEKYKILKNGIRVNSPCDFSWKELAQIMSQELK